MSLTAGGSISNLHLDSQAKLIEGLKNGDENAVKQLVFLYSDRLLQVATLILKDQYLAEDVVQESLLVAINKIHQLRGDDLSPWLYRILVNRCRKEQRKKPWSVVEYLPKNELELVPATGVDVERDVLEKDTDREVMYAIAQLPARYREVVTLYYLEEFSLETIAKVTQEPLGTIKSRLHRARKRLQKILIEGGFFDGFE
ncbi:MAG: RNA polymerase sigma factor [Bacillota bacterium]|nr:RNA polymerase sigma factor [Bacillota bacterium]HOA90185.1 RNA polymerase sigma factor [Bacillota bacterium]HOP54721.1 RNA polymerase sigma factor [Bacillota bacterium]HPT62215.1 RNA polymerase sigma factor [Bacillota bacterium]HPZ72990.1 RNA polymerase sigma factor [Bacillota bacterium]